MKKQAFSLKPFADNISGIAIKGQVARHKTTLIAHYELSGNLLKIDIPERKQKPSRVKGLWQNTCFELFVAARDCHPYWEFNLSPSGDWNVFRFEHYDEERCAADLKEELLVASLPFRTQKGPGSFSLDLEFNSGKLVREDRLLEIGVSAVIKSGERSYWALTHCGSRPDFHRRDSFILNL